MLGKADLIPNLRTPSLSILLRPYCSGDCIPTAALFRETVHAVNAHDYTFEQREAWAPAERDLVTWNRSLLEHCALVAVLCEAPPVGSPCAEPGLRESERAKPSCVESAHIEPSCDGPGPVGETIVGFGDIDLTTGYLDRLYVHKDYQRRGVATALCDALERAYFDSCIAAPRVQGDIPDPDVPVEAPRSITTHASITARPFFERRGYLVVRKQHAARRVILLTNYLMEKPFPCGR